jgi:hypothetical protein
MIAMFSKPRRGEMIVANVQIGVTDPGKKLFYNYVSPAGLVHPVDDCNVFQNPVGVKMTCGHVWQTFDIYATPTGFVHSTRLVVL